MDKKRKKLGPTKTEPLEPASAEVPAADVQYVQGLLHDVLLEEASTKVWQRFESILETLPPGALEIFECHLDGFSAKEIGKKTKVPEKEIEDLIRQLKADIVRHLRSSTSVRQ